jgi:hypothetical protein
MAYDDVPSSPFLKGEEGGFADDLIPEKSPLTLL